MKHTLKIISLCFCSMLFAACSTISSSAGKGGEKAAGPQSVEIYTDDRTTQTYAEEKTPTVMDTQSAEIASGIIKEATAEQAATGSVIATTAQNKPLAVQSAPTSVKPAYTEDGSSLSLNMPYQQVWANAQKALPQAGYPIMEQDSASGTYYILDKAGSGGVIQRNTPIYQLQIQKKEDQTVVVHVKNAQNTAASADITRRVFTVLKNTLPK